MNDTVHFCQVHSTGYHSILHTGPLSYIWKLLPLELCQTLCTHCSSLFGPLNFDCVVQICSHSLIDNYYYLSFTLIQSALRPSDLCIP